MIRVSLASMQKNVRLLVVVRRVAALQEVPMMRYSVVLCAGYKKEDGSTS